MGYSLHLALSPLLPVLYGTNNKWVTFHIKDGIQHLILKRWKFPQKCHVLIFPVSKFSISLRVFQFYRACIRCAVWSRWHFLILDTLYSFVNTWCWKNRKCCNIVEIPNCLLVFSFVTNIFLFPCCILYVCTYSSLPWCHKRKSLYMFSSLKWQ